MSSAAPKRLSPEQKELWDELQIHVPKPSGQQTRPQAVNLAVFVPLWWISPGWVQASPGQKQ